MNQIHRKLQEITTKDSVYDQLIETSLYPNLQYKKELISEIAIAMLNEDKEEKMVKMIEEGWFKYWLASVVKNQIKSTTSSFHKNVRNFHNNKRIVSLTTNDEYPKEYENIIDSIKDEDNTDIEEKILFEDRLDIISQARQEVECTWFESEMFRYYYDNGMTYREIEEEYGIDHCLVFHSVKKVREKLKNIIETKTK